MHIQTARARQRARAHAGMRTHALALFHPYALPLGFTGCAVNRMQAAHLADLQRCAAAAVADGLQNETVSGWASLGAGGRFSNNVERDMHRWTRGAFNVELSLYHMKLTVRNPRGLGVMEILHPVLLPHELIGASFAAGRVVWECCFGKSADVGPFWQHVMATHEDTDWYDDMDHRIPICLHGDGAPCFNGQSIMHFCFSSPLAVGDANASRFVVTSVPCSLLVPGVTVQQVLDLLQWSITIAAAGSYPERGFHGEVLRGHRAALANQRVSGQWKVAFYGLKGDLEWLRIAMAWVQNYNCTL